MSITKYATFEQAEVLDLKGAPSQQHFASLERIADFENYRTGDGYLYVRIRAISSRVNRNHDGWPSVELAGSPEIFDRHQSSTGFTVEAAEGNPEFGFSTFIGKPIFVDHHNSNPKKARGVIVDAKLNVLDHKTATAHDSYWGGHNVDSEHMPPTEVELLLEVDAKSFPRLAQSIISSDLDGFSMGCDVEKSKCSHCGHIATNPEEYCSHILMKGAHHDLKTADGKRTSKKSYENCYGIKFFEISAVFDPADETALAREVRSAVNKEADIAPGSPQGTPGALPDPVRPYDSRIEDLAMQLEMQGIDGETALQMAQNEVEKKQRAQGQPTPGYGEGGSIEEHYIPRRPSGLELPPPVRPGLDPGNSFQQAAEEALNEQYPQRPVMNDPRWSKTAQNPEPQEFMTRAPDEIDTLRDEQLCPICGNDMDSETCSICGYVQPPKEYDNPDLDQATKIRERMKEQEEQTAEGEQPGVAPTQPGEQIGEPQQQSGPLTSQMPKKAPTTGGVRSDMRWTPKVHPKTAARINQVERPITSSNPPKSDEPRNETVIKDQTKPVTSAMMTAQQLMANAQRNHGEQMNTRTADGPTPPGDTAADVRTEVTGVGGVDQASNDAASKADAQVDVTGIGTTGVSDVSADKSESLPTAGRDGDDSGFNTDKTTEDSGPTKTYGDKDGEHPGVTDPVTSEVPSWTPESNWEKANYSHQHRAYDDGTLEQNEQQGDPVAQGGSAVKGVQPIAEQFGDRVNVLEHTTSPSNNSGPTDTWSGTDGNGVLKQQEPVTREDQEWGGVKVPDVQLHTTGRVSLAAMRLAEMEVELGLIEPQQKWNRMAELDVMHPQVLGAQLETLSKVKTAGLNRLAAHRQGSVTRVPRAFGKQTAAPDGFKRIASDTETTESQPITDESLDAGLFLR